MCVQHRVYKYTTKLTYQDVFEDLTATLAQKRHVLALAMLNLDPVGSSNFRAELPELMETWSADCYATGTPKALS